MPYQAPTRQELEKSIENPLYKKNNPDRLLAIHLLKEIKKHDSEVPEDVLIGAVLLGLYSIDDEPKYKVSRWLTADGSWLLNKGSDLKQEYKTLLKISPENILDDRQQYIYLERLFNYFKDRPQTTTKIINTLNALYNQWRATIKLEPAPSRWFSEELLLNDITKQMSAILNNPNNKKGMRGLLKGLPALSVLKDKVSHAIEKYKKLFELESKIQKKPKKKPNPKRDLAINILEFANDTCDHFYGLKEKLEVSTLDEDEFRHNLELRYNIRAGAILSVMKELEREYEGYDWLFWTAEHSELYKNCQEALNIKHSDDLPQFVQGKFIRSMFSYLDNAPEVAKNPKKYGIEEAAMKNVTNNWMNISRQLHLLSAPKHELAPVVSARIGGTVNHCTQFVFNSAAGSITDIVCIPQSAKHAVKALGGAIGYAMLGPAGAILGSYTAGLVANRVVPGLLATPVVGMLEPFSKALGAAMGTIVTVAIYPIEGASKGLYKLIVTSNEEITEQQRKEIKANSEFLSSLRRSPAKVFSEENKAKLATVTEKAEYRASSGMKA